MDVPEITIATSVRYGSYKHLFDDALGVVAVIVYNFDKIKKHFKLPENLLFHLRPIRNEQGKAYFFKESRKKNAPIKYCIELDIRQTKEELCDTILHELTHIEQFYDKRLEDSKKPGHFKWLGENMSFCGITMEEYKNLPWEREAIKKAEKLLKPVFGKELSDNKE